jgi:hypothetical protein
MRSRPNASSQFKDIPNPSDSKRPAWLTFLCIFVGLYLLITTPCILFGIVGGISWSSPVVPYWTLALLYFIIICVAGIGLWRMKKWGALLYLLYLVLDIVPNVFDYTSGNYGLLPFKIPWLDFVDRIIIVKYDANLKLIAEGPWLSHFGISNIPYIWITITLDIVYYVLLAVIGSAILKLWIDKKLG